MTSKMCRFCYMTLTKEFKENGSAICGQHLELLGTSTVKKIGQFFLNLVD